MNRLESRGRLLLRAYPQPYRTERGAEILGTLLDAAPAGRNWPPRREAWSLVTCGLRVRAARNRRLPLVTNLRLAAILAAAIWLAQSAALYQQLAYELAISHQLVPAALLAVCALTACLATASAWFWRRSVTFALAVVVLAALMLVSRQIGGLIGASTVVPPLALAALATGKERPPRGWLWLPAAVIIAQLPGLPYLAIRSWPFAFLPLAPVMLLGVLGVTLLWFMADARPLIAFGIYLEVICALAAADAMQGTATAGYGVAIALLAAVLAGASLRVRRQAGPRQV